jgi:putative ATPase
MLLAGEDPKFIARRIFVHASEDVGNADPQAICVAAAAMYAVNTIGLPEARINLAQAALYIAMAPKSNSACMGIDKAIAYVQEHPSNDIPDSMRDTHYKSASKLGRGEGYEYPHDYPLHWVKQQYLPDLVKDAVYYTPKLNKYEMALKKFDEERRK